MHERVERWHTSLVRGLKMASLVRGLKMASLGRGLEVDGVIHLRRLTSSVLVVSLAVVLVRANIASWRATAAAATTRSPTTATFAAARCPLSAPAARSSTAASITTFLDNLDLTVTVTMGVAGAAVMTRAHVKWCAGHGDGTVERASIQLLGVGHLRPSRRWLQLLSAFMYSL